MVRRSVQMPRATGYVAPQQSDAIRTTSVTFSCTGIGHTWGCHEKSGPDNPFRQQPPLAAGPRVFHPAADLGHHCPGVCGRGHGVARPGVRCRRGRFLPRFRPVHDRDRVSASRLRPRIIRSCCSGHEHPRPGARRRRMGQRTGITHLSVAALAPGCVAAAGGDGLTAQRRADDIRHTGERVALRVSRRADTGHVTGSRSGIAVARTRDQHADHQ